MFLLILKRTPLLRKREDFRTQHMRTILKHNEKATYRAQPLLWLKKIHMTKTGEIYSTDTVVFRPSRKLELVWIYSSMT